jgi:hypothetical protein
MVQIIQSRADAGQIISDGHFKLQLNYSGTVQTTAAIASGASATALQTALEAMSHVDTVALPQVDSVSVSVTRSSADAEGGYTWTVIFSAHGQHAVVPLMTVTEETITATHTVSNVLVAEQAGIGVGDVIIINFDKDTNYPIVTTKSDFDTLFYTVSSLGGDYSAEWAWVQLAGTGQATSGSSTVTTTDDLRSTLNRGDRVKISTDERVVHHTDEYTSNTLPLTIAYLGANSGTGLPIYRQSYRKILLTITNITSTAPFSQTAVGTWLMAVKATGNLQTTDESSVPSTAISPRLTGTWGAHSTGPVIQSVIATNDGGQQGIGEGDTITVVLDKDTNEPGSELEVQQIRLVNATGGNFTLTYESQSTGALSFNATNAEVLAELEALLTIRPGGVSVSRQTVGSTELVWEVTFSTTCPIGNGDLNELVEDGSNLLYGSSGSLTVSEVTKGNMVTQTAIGNVFDFSSSIGLTYSGYWTSPSTFKLTIVNQSYAAIVELTKVGVLAVSVKNSSILTTADKSSGTSTSTGVLTGSWGSHSPPNITSFEAVESGTSQPGLGVGDRVTITFDKITNIPAVDTKAGVDNLLSFSASLAVNYSGYWANQYTLIITVINATSFDNEYSAGYSLTRVGLLQVAVKVTGNLTSADETSAPSTSVATLTGTWGAHPAPEISAIVATNNGGQQGLGNGDTITVRFDRHVKQLPVSTKADLFQIFSFSAELGNNFTGAWLSYKALQVTLTDVSGTAPFADTKVGTLNAVVNASASLQSADLSSPSSGSNSTLSGSWGFQDAPFFLSITATDSGSSPGLNDNDTVTILFNKDTNTPAVHTKTLVDSVLSFSASLGIDYSATWISLTTLQIRLTNTSGAAPASRTKITTLQITLKASGGLVTADYASPSANASGVLGAGTWGNHSAPVISSVTVADSGLQQGMGANDTIVVVFDRDTNAISVHEIQEITTTADSTISGTFTITYDGYTTTPVAVDANEYAVDVALEALVSIGENGVTVSRGPVGVNGVCTWTVTFTHCRVCLGALSKMTVNGSSLSGLNAAITVSERIKGNTLNKAVVDSVFSFSANLGTDYSATWGSSVDTVIITLINQTGRDSYLASRVGELVITVKQSGNLRTSDLYSPQSFSSLNTSGTWGAHSPPTISTALAYSGASSQAGFDNDDVVEISFDKETNEP